MQKASPETRKLLGGAVCLDFANSVDWAPDGSERPPHTDVLISPQALAVWGSRLGLAAPGVVISGRELSAARTLRAAVHGVLAAIASGRAPDAEALAQLGRDYADAARKGHFAVSDQSWRLSWAPDDPRRIRFRVAVSAVDLLTDPTRLGRLRMCPGQNCGWLFLDGSGRRRWCSMQVCGSRAKMRRYYERRRAGSPPWGR
jgi:predicted RNA-binding Zn ribbon-like protein